MSVPEKAEPVPPVEQPGAPRQKVIGQVSRFTVVGILATLTYFVVANALIFTTKTDAKIASLSAYVAGMAVSFFGQSRFTFRISSTRFGHIWRFVVLSVLGLLVSYFSVPFVERVLGMHASWATLLTMVLVPLLSFILMKFWVFAARD